MKKQKNRTPFIGSLILGLSMMTKYGVMDMLHEDASRGELNGGDKKLAKKHKKLQKAMRKFKKHLDKKYPGPDEVASDGLQQLFSEVEKRFAEKKPKTEDGKVNLKEEFQAALLEALKGSGLDTKDLKIMDIRGKSIEEIRQIVDDAKQS